MKKVVAILGNDYHLGTNNLKLVENIWNQQLELCVKFGKVPFVVGGDIFTYRSGQPLAVLSLFKELLDKTVQIGVKVIIIPGNHDKTALHDTKSYLDVFKREGVNICSEETSIKAGNVDITLIPFFDNEEWLRRFYNVQLFGNNPHILITHMGIEGVRNNDGSIVSSPIKPSMFKDYDAVFIGHYHDSMQLGNNVYYTGSVYQNNFGENSEDKGFTVIYNDGTFDFIQSKFPKYIKEIVDVKDNDTLNNVIEKYEDNKEDYVRIVFKGKKEDLKNVNKSILESKGFLVQYLPNEQTAAMESAESEGIVEYNKESLLTDFKQYCDDNNIVDNKFEFGFNLIKQL